MQARGDLGRVVERQAQQLAGETAIQRTERGVGALEGSEVALDGGDVASSDRAGERTEDVVRGDIAGDVEHQWAERGVGGLAREAGERPRALCGGGECDDI